MQTQDKNSIDTRGNHSPVEPRKLRARLAGLSAFIVVLLVVGVSVFVFAEARQSQGSQRLPAGQWKQVQTGYLFLSMQTAPSNPAVLYACATTSAAVSNIHGPDFTILRSADFGDHWQNVGANAGLGSYCEVAVSPTNANDIYAVSTNSVSQSTVMLKHSTDGGQIWTTITPTFNPPLLVTGTSVALPWFVQQLHFDGNSLYGVQWLATSIRLQGIQSPPAIANRLPRLVTSSDGGRTWRIIDSQLTTKGMGAQSYTLDPAHPGTIYEIAGRPLLPIETAPVPTNDILPRFVLDQRLFKSTDNGASWQSLLTGLPYGSHVQLASDNSQIVYVGGIRGPLPLVFKYQPGGKGTEYQPAPFSGAFQLQVSIDGGASWQKVAAPSNEQVIQNWFVSADGQVYTSPTITFSAPGVGSTAIAGTAIVGTAVPVMPATPVFGTPLPVKTATGGMPDIQSTLPVSHPGIQRYDLASHSWSQVTTPPANGHLLEVTPANTHGGAILWYVGLQGTHYALYRYTV